MNWYHWTALLSLLLCISGLIYHFTRLLRKGNPVDFAKAAGSAAAGIRYSFTGAMNPRKKESAYLHLPTYTAGLAYHAGTFLSLAVFAGSFFEIPHSEMWKHIIAVLLVISSLSGIGILIRRMSVGLMRRLSNADDYLSNLLVTGFQLLTVIHLFFGMGSDVFYYLAASLMLLYIPAGKLKHLMYFFAARYHLGNFYGRRGVWGR